MRDQEGDPFADPTVRALTSHMSIRKYLERPVDERTLDAVLSCAQSAPTSSHKQAYSVIRVSDPVSRAALAVVADDQEWVEEAPVFLVWCADLYRVRRVVEMAGASAAYDNIEELVVATVDTTLAAAYAFAAAESLGLGGVMIGGLRNDPDRVTRTLSLPALVFPMYGMCLGYPDEDPGVKPRLPRDLVVFEDRYDPDRIVDGLPAYDDVVRRYYSVRESNSRETTWTSEMVRKFAEAQRPHLRSYLDRQGFKFE